MSSLYRVLEAHNINHYLLPHSRFVRRVDQLTRGKFYAKTEALYHRELNIFRRFTNQTIREVGLVASPLNSLSLHLESNRFYLKGSYYGEGIVSYTAGNNQFESITKANSVHYTLTINEEALPTYFSESELSVLLNFFKIRRDITFCGDTCHLTIQNTIANTFDRLSGQKEGMICGNWIDEVRELIFRTLLCLVKNSTFNQLRKNSSGFLLDKALTLINKTSAENISVTELARSLHTNRRNVELAFNTYLALSPKEYINNLRLNNIRTKLMGATYDANKVSQIARSFGVIHLGNFSKAYKTLFGEYPRQTLARSPIDVAQ